MIVIRVLIFFVFFFFTTYFVRFIYRLRWIFLPHSRESLSRIMKWRKLILHCKPWMALNIRCGLYVKFYGRKRLKSQIHASHQIKTDLTSTKFKFCHNSWRWKRDEKLCHWNGSSDAKKLLFHLPFKALRRQTKSFLVYLMTLFIEIE